MRKLISIFLALMLALSASAMIAETAEPAPEALALTGPYVLTSAGQSADFQMVKTMLKMNKVENFTEDALLSPETMPEDTATIIIVIGGSSKGLGAAGIDAEQELERIDSVVKYAAEKEIPILAMHIGGAARRGELSDKFIEPVVAVAQACIVVEEANLSDDLFGELGEKYEVPMTFIQKKSDGATALKDILH
ncbi:MAG: DUF6305 family protein [Eubacteriales bacterium]|jgi:dihydropteroate synthase|nr:DUF6305 family protein [Eubacteriales bacterium]MDD4105796.1 DUF6305 family protein [Eubacteriales bacterium]MDD4711043.1 DUF6305 family protein [Eubacteriales bacterium]